MRPNTLAGYQSKVRLYIIEPLGTKKLCDITQDDIKGVLKTLDTTQSESSYRLVHMLLRKIFGAAKRNKLIDDDPTEGLPCKGGIPQKPRDALSDDEVALLLAAVKGLVVKLFILIALYAGLRREEILGLRWENVLLDVQAPYIRVRHAWRISHNRPEVTEELKSPAAKRDVPIPEPLLSALVAEKELSTSDFVIHNKNGGPLTETQWRNLWKKVVVRSTMERTYTRYTDGEKKVHTVTPVLGASAAHNPGVIYSLPFKVTPHQLRHTYITNLIHLGVDPKTVQYLAGHEKIKTTMDIYAKVKYQHPEDLAPALNEAFARFSDRLKEFREDD